MGVIAESCDNVDCLNPPTTSRVGDCGCTFRLCDQHAAEYDRTSGSAVLSWLRDRDSRATSILSMKGCGTDWAGSTEEGFYSRFGVDIEYETQNGEKVVRCVEGEEMASLWKVVVSDA